MTKNNKIIYTIDICNTNSIKDLRTEIAFQKFYNKTGLTNNETNLIVEEIVSTTFNALLDLINVIRSIQQKEETNTKKTLWSKIKDFFKFKK